MGDTMMAAAAGAEIQNWFVVCMGIGTVFVGLICIILLCKVVSFFCRLGEKKKQPETVVSPVAAEDGNRQEILAAVTAVIAEELGTDVSAIRVHSFKKIG